MEAGSGSTLTVFFALFGSCVSSDHSGGLEGRAVILVDQLETARDAVSDGAGLAGESAAVHVREHVELVYGVRLLKGLIDDLCHPGDDGGLRPVVVGR